MYTCIDNIFSFGSFIGLILGCTYGNSSAIIGCSISYILYPIVTEVLYNILSSLTYNDQQYKQDHKIKHEHLTKFTGIIYNNRYNITACGIEKLHPFDSTKYQRVYQQLIQESVITQNDIYAPEKCSRQTLLKFNVSKIYLYKLCYSLYLTTIVEVPICIIPGSVLRWRVLDPMLYATQGTIDGSCKALDQGWAINLSGGYHHACKQVGGGFCVYPDISIAIEHLFKYHDNKVKRILLVDLDAHQGNGHERDFLNNENVYIIDFFNPNIYPNDSYAKQAIRQKVQITFYDDDAIYLNKMNLIIQQGIQEFQPDFIFYNAGTDCMENDPLGNMNISPDGIIKRDELMFELSINRKIPILMVLSGGYQPQNAPVIARSIKNLFQKFNLKNNESININFKK